MQDAKRARVEDGASAIRQTSSIELDLTEEDVDGADTFFQRDHRSGRLFIVAPPGCDEHHLMLWRLAHERRGGDSMRAFFTETYWTQTHRTLAPSSDGDASIYNTCGAAVAFAHPRDLVMALELAIYMGKHVDIWAKVCAFRLVQIDEVLHDRDGMPFVSRLGVHKPTLDALVRSTAHVQDAVMTQAGGYCSDQIWPEIKASGMDPEIASTFIAIKALQAGNESQVFGRFDEDDASSDLEARTAARLVIPPTICGS